jgi:hypothetical protein
LKCIAEQTLLYENSEMPIASDPAENGVQKHIGFGR